MSLTGGCLCGGVRYRVDDVPGQLVYCHCSQCRKAQGVAFAANVPVARERFEIVEGNALLASYRHTPGKARTFCRRCGSPLYSALDGADKLRLRAGSLDPPVALRPVAHIFAGDGAGWCAVDDGLPRYPGREPGRR